MTTSEYLMEEKGNEILIGISKHIITLSVATIAGLVSLIEVTERDLDFIVLAKISIIAACIAIVSAILLQVTVASKVLGETNRIPVTPKIFYSVSWGSFLVSGVSGGAFLFQVI